MKTKYEKLNHYDEARELMKQENNPVVDYIGSLINPIEDFFGIRSKKHAALLEFFGFDPNDDDLYLRSKHILGNIPDIICCEMQNVLSFSDIINNKLMEMMVTQVPNKQLIDDVSSHIISFMTRQKTKDFLHGELESVNDISIYDYVFLKEDNQSCGWHGFYKWLRRKRGNRS